jgi:hypothetical protein
MKQTRRLTQDQKDEIKLKILEDGAFCGPEMHGIAIHFEVSLRTVQNVVNDIGSNLTEQKTERPLLT